MSEESIQKTIEFILDRQAKAEVEIQELREMMARLGKQSAETDKKIVALASEAQLDRQFMRESIDQISDAVGELTTDVNKLVNIVENTRDFAQEVAKLAIITEKRVRNLEGN